MEAVVQSYNLGEFQTDLSPRHVRVHTSRIFRSVVPKKPTAAIEWLSTQRRVKRWNADFRRKRESLILYEGEVFEVPLLPQF